VTPEVAETGLTKDKSRNVASEMQACDVIDSRVLSRVDAAQAGLGCHV
jgi:hypothetical protein